MSGVRNILLSTIGFLSIVLIIIWASSVNVGVLSLSNTQTQVATDTDASSPHRMWMRMPKSARWSMVGGAFFPDLRECERALLFKYKIDPRFRGRTLICCPASVHPNDNIEMCAHPYKV